MLNRIAAVAVGLIMTLIVSGTSAQGFPNKPIRVVIGFPAGSAADSIVRSFTPQMQAELGQPLIIESRPGAKSIPAMQLVTAQPADGYTIFYMTSTVAVVSATPKPAYDIRKDLTLIGLATQTPLYLAVNSEKIQAKTTGELISFIRSKPGKVNFSSYGIGSLAHLAIELLSQQGKMSVVHVPYKGSADNARALVAGDTHVAFDVGSVLFPQADSGRIRILASSTENPWAGTPQIPGMRSAGLTDFNAVIWNGFAGPAGMPQEITRRLNAAINSSLKSSLAIDFARKTAQQLTSSSPEEFTQFVNKDIETWSGVIRRGKIELD